jgi:hypothetical protein
MIRRPSLPAATATPATSDDTAPAPSEEDIERILRRLSASQAYVIRLGITHSPGQRIRLIDKGLADPACRGAPPRPRRPDALSRSYDLPLTRLGLLIRARLDGG